MAKLTVRDLFEKKGKQKLTELYVTNSLEAYASEQAGIDILIVSFNRSISEANNKKIQEEFVEHIKKAVELDIAYAHDVLPTGILGLNADMFVDYMYYIGNRRLEAIGLEYRFPSDNNPFPWLGEVVDVQAMGNFFERRVREYQQSGSLEDDF